MKVGGHGIRDELKREDEAYSLARDRQRELEIDAEAWKLLGEALEESEKEGSTPFGQNPGGSRLGALRRTDKGALRRPSTRPASQSRDCRHTRRDDRWRHSRGAVRGYTAIRSRRCFG